MHSGEISATRFSEIAKYDEIVPRDLDVFQALKEPEEKAEKELHEKKSEDVKAAVEKTEDVKAAVEEPVAEKKTEAKEVVEEKAEKESETKPVIEKQTEEIKANEEKTSLKGTTEKLSQVLLL